MDQLETISYAKSKTYICYDQFKNTYLTEIHPEEHKASTPDLMDSIPDSEKVMKQSINPSDEKILNNFCLNLSVLDIGLYIEAEQQTTGKIYRTVLNSEDISLIFCNLITKPDELADNINIALSGDESSMSFEISDEAVITIRIKARVGKLEKVMTYRIKLEECKLSHLELCERYLRKLQETILKKELNPFYWQLLRVMKQIIGHSQQMEKELNEALERVKLLEEQMNKPQEKKKKK